MSLINRMLRDLSSRQSRTGEVLSGIPVPRVAARSGPNWSRLAFLLVLVAGFTAAFWFLLARKVPPPVPAPVAASPAPAPVAAASTRFRLDTTLSPVTGMRAVPPRARSAKSASPQAAAAEARHAAPAAAAATNPRDAREASDRSAEAARALGRGESKTAEQGFRDALSLDPANRAARESLVALLLDQGRLAEAQDELDAGLALAPDHTPYRRLAARLDLARGQPGLAVQRLEPSPPTVTSDPEYHGLLASAYQRLGRHEDAARVYRSLTGVQPSEAHWWVGYGLSRDALGDVPGALSAYAQARSLGGLQPRVLEHINQRTAVLSAGG